jgi:hypothetical protein
MNAQLVGNKPYLATLPSCTLYVRGAAGTNILDWSPKKRTLTNASVANVTSSPSPYLPPASLGFNGSAKLFAGSSTDFSGTKVFAAAFLVYRTGTVTQAIYSSDDISGTPGNFAFNWNSTNGLYFQYRDGSTWNIPGSSPTNLSANVWHFVAAIGDGTNVRLYIDSTTAVATHAITNNLTDQSGIGIGNTPSGTSFPFTGNLDEVMFFNGALGPVPTIGMLYPYYRRLIA